MRISNQTLKLLIAIAGIVIIFLMIFSTFQIMSGGIVWLEWGYLLGGIFITWLSSKVPQRRKRPLLGLYMIILSAFPFALIFLPELLLLTYTILLITFIVACIVAIFYPERRHPR